MTEPVGESTNADFRPRVFCAVSQPPEGGVPVIAITTVHKDDYDEALKRIAELTDLVVERGDEVTRLRLRLLAAIPHDHYAQMHPARPGEPVNGCSRCALEEEFRDGT